MFELVVTKNNFNSPVSQSTLKIFGVIFILESVLIDEKQVSASECFEKSLDIFEKLKMEANYAQTLYHFAQHKFSQGDRPKAKELLSIEKEISNRLEINTKAKCGYFKNQLFESQPDEFGF